MPASPALSRSAWLLAGLCFALLLPSPARAQVPFSDCAINTGGNATALIPDDTNPTIGGEPFAVGDRIAVFTPAGLCAGVAEWKADGTGLSIWGDDIQTAEVDGFLAGEAISYAVWDASADEIYTDDAISLTYSNDRPYYRTDGLYATGALYFIGSLTVTPPSTPPAPPSLVAPSNGATNQPLAVTLSWNAVDEATGYDVQVATSNTFTSIVRQGTGLTGTSFDAASLNPSTTYFWRVRATGDGGASAWSAVRSFTTENPDPETPELIAPDDGATGLPTSPTLTWQAVDGGGSYTVQVSTSPSFGALDFTLTTAGTSAQPADLDPNTLFYWRVRSVRSGETSAWSAVRSFTTEALPPPAPSLQQPANGATNLTRPVTLEWLPATDATSYRVQVATASTFGSSIVAQATGLTATNYIAEGLAAETTYFWRVRGQGPGGTGAWSAVRSFTTEPPPPGVPVLTSPSNGATNQPYALSLAWDAAAGTQRYDVQVATDGAFGTLVVTADDLTATTFALTDLSPSTIYFWRVRGQGPGGTGAWSEPFQFTTRPLPPAAPDLLAPADGATGVDRTPTLTWTSVNGATSYTVQLAVSETFGTLTFQRTVDDTGLVPDNLSASATYFWRVRAIGPGGTSPWSAVRSFTTAAPAPDAPEAPPLVAPADGDASLTDPVTLRWNAVSGATSYTAQVARSASFATPEVVEATSGTDLVLAALTPGVTYYWRIRATGNGGTGPWSSTRSFSLALPAPAAPTLDAPADGATGVATTIPLTWNLADGATSYQVVLARTAAFADPVLDATTAQPAAAAQGLDPSTTYFWRVRAVGPGGTSPWSPTRTFVTEAPPAQAPEPPLLLSPTDGAADVEAEVVLRWAAADRATGYTLQLARSTAFNDVVADVTTASTEAAVEDLDVAATYFWRVRASGEGGTSAWSAVRSFTTAAPPDDAPDAPTLLNPADRVTSLNDDPTLQWAAVDGATRYAVQVARTSAFSPLLVDATTETTELDLEPLEPGATYHWRVRAGNDSGFGAWSTARRFTIVRPSPTVPALREPADGAGNIAIPVTVRWAASLNTSTYTLQVARGDAFTDLVREQTLTGVSATLTDLDVATTYSWRVRATGEGGTSAWSDVRTFTTTVPPPPTPTVPQPVVPANDVRNLTLPVTLLWQGVADADGYAVEVAEDPTFQVGPRRFETADTSLTVPDLAFSTTYFWRVRTTADGAEWSPTFRFATRSGDPTPPTLRSPTAGATVPVPTQFQWAAVAGARSYVLQVATDDAFTAASVAQEVSLEATTFTVANLDFATTYFWRVRGTDSDGLGLWSEVRSFTTQALPPPALPPRLVSPTDGAARVATSLALNWQRVAFADSYVAQVAQDPSFEILVAQGVLSGSDQFVVSSLQFEKTYYWRVRAENATGVSPWSPVQTFRTVGTGQAPVPIAPALIAPTQDETLVSRNPSVSWRSVGGATSYVLQVSSEDDFATVAQEQRGLTQPFTFLSNLDASQTYFWRVRAEGLTGGSPWSQVYSFTTRPAETTTPTEPTPEVPTDVQLDANYPNPFNPTTIIGFALPTAQDITLQVYDLQGRLVATLATGPYPAGAHRVQWTATGLASGLYFYRLLTPTVQIARPMLLVK